MWNISLSLWQTLSKASKQSKMCFRLIWAFSRETIVRFESALYNWCFPGKPILVRVTNYLIPSTFFRQPFWYIVVSETRISAQFLFSNHVICKKTDFFIRPTDSQHVPFIHSKVQSTNGEKVRLFCFNSYCRRISYHYYQWVKGSIFEFVST